MITCKCDSCNSSVFQEVKTRGFQVTASIEAKTHWFGSCFFPIYKEYAASGFVCKVFVLVNNC